MKPLQKLKRKFEIAYMVVKENLAFKKMKPLCDIEESNGVDIGQVIVMIMAMQYLLNILPQICKKGLNGKLSRPDFFFVNR